MTLLFMDALQEPITFPKPEYSGNFSGSAVTGRDGQANGAYDINGGTTAISRVLTLPTSAATCFVGIANRQAQLNDQHYVTTFRDSANTTQLIVYVNSSGFIEVRRTNFSGTLLGTSSGHAPISVNQWNYFETKATLHTSTGIVTVRLNGVTVLTLTGQATSSTISNVFSLVWSNPNAAGNTANFYDDLYVLDAVDATATQGQPNNDFLGDVRVQALFPNAAGDTTGWTPSTGSNFQTVDETPPNTTDFNSVVATSTGTRDLYNLNDLTGTIAAVYAVRVHVIASKTDSGLALIKPVIKENSVVTADSSQPLTVGQFTQLSSILWPRKPSGPSLWTSSDVNALQAGVEVG